MNTGAPIVTEDEAIPLFSLSDTNHSMFIDQDFPRLFRFYILRFNKKKFILVVSSQYSGYRFAAQGFTNNHFIHKTRQIFIKFLWLFILVNLFLSHIHITPYSAC